MHYRRLNDEVMKAGLNAANSLKPGIDSLLNASVGSMLYPTLKIDHPCLSVLAARISTCRRQCKNALPMR
ncbi:exported lipase [Klebsiella grimontii]|uniref:Exported lipase n=1 Tax=Klebsiella grimontii TaxID=2058152 RepID=A0A7H4P3W9_9ENTR|nr:exported lipase [Klebsiella grimontii]